MGNKKGSKKAKNTAKQKKAVEQPKDHKVKAFVKEDGRVK